MKKQKIKLFPLVLLIIFTAINLLFTKLPLLNTLHYEVSAINAVLVSLFSALITAYFLRREESKKKLFPANEQYFIFVFLLLFVSFIIPFVSTVFCKHCPAGSGILFYIVSVAPAVVIGSTIAILSLHVSKRFSYPVILMFWLILLFGFLPELYSNPQIYFYNPIFGYFPGTMYDENIEVTKSFIFYRAFNVIFSLSVFIIISYTKKLNKYRQPIVLSTVILLYLSAGILKPSLGFASTKETIQSELQEQLYTKHFEIICSEDITPTEKKVLMLEHEYSFERIKKMLGYAPERKITSFVFKTGAQKKKLFGSKNADVAKLWNYQIYLNFKNYGNSLTHEIAHVFSAKWGKGVFKMPAKYNPALLEGFAMAVENNYDDFDIDYLANLACKNNYEISLKKLFSGFSFFSNTSSVSYIYAGSFIKYLANTYGWQKVNSLYSSLNFTNIFGKKFEILEKEFESALSGKNFAVNKNVADLYFGRLPLVKKKCPHEAAKQLKQARKKFKLKKYKLALKKFKEVYGYSETYSALNGIIRSYIKTGKYENAEKLLNENMEKYKGTSYYFALENLAGNVFVYLNKIKQAEIMFKKIIEQNPRANYINIAKIKLYLIKNNTSKLKNFLKDDKKRKKIITDLLEKHPADAVLQTVTSFRFTQDEFEKINPLIKKAVDTGKYSSDTYFQLSKFAYKFLDFRNAEYLAELSLQNVKPERREIVKELLQKIKWSESNSQTIK